MVHHRRLRPALAAALALVPAAARADVPPLLVPPHADSVSIASPPAPFLDPGRLGTVDSSKLSRAARASREYQLGLALRRQGSSSAALLAFLNAARLDTTLAGPQREIASLYASRQQWRPAAMHYATELGRHPGDREAGRGLGLALAQLGDTTRALAQLHLLVRRDPRDEPAWQALGFACVVAGRLDEGERALRRALALDPKDSDAWRDLGVVLAARGRGDDARDAYRRSAVLDRHDATALVDLGNLESRAGRHAEALAAYQEAEARDSTQAFVYLGQVRELIALGREGDAGPVYRRWLAAHPEDANVRIEAMHHFERHGRADIALELGREAVRVEPRSGAAWLELAAAQEAAGDLRGAVTALREAERWLGTPGSRARARVRIAHLRAASPDSLRAFFAADSAAHPAPAGDDSSAASSRAP